MASVPIFPNPIRLETIFIKVPFVTEIDPMLFVPVESKTFNSNLFTVVEVTVYAIDILYH